MSRRELVPLVLLCLASCSHRTVPNEDSTAPPGSDSYPADKSSAEPLVLFVEQAEGPELAPLWIYNRNGVKVRDLAESLDLGPGYEAIRISAGGTVLTARPPSPGTRAVRYVRGELPGIAWQRTETQVVVRALLGEGDGESIRLIGLSTSGRSTFDFEVAGSWDDVHLSPAGRYLFGDNGEEQVVIDTQTRKIVWTGETNGALFTRDDSMLVYATEGAVAFQPLPQGGPKHHPHPLGQGRWPQLQLVTQAGVIVLTSGNITDGQFLGLVTPDGDWTWFNPDLLPNAEEKLVGFAQQGQLLLFARHAQYGDKTEAPTGLFAFDLEALEVVRHYSSPTDPPAGGFFPLPEPFFPFPVGYYAGERFFAVEHNQRLITWRLDDPTSQLLESFTLPEEGWYRGVESSSAEGMVIVVGSMWGMGRAPSSYPPDGTTVVSIHGERLFELPPGFCRLDRTGRLLVHYAEQEPSQAGEPSREQATIGNVASKKNTRIEGGRSFAIIYGPAR